MDTADKIRSFANLPVGWNYGKGGPIKPVVINLALGILPILHERSPQSNAFPGDDGEILLTSYLPDGTTLEVTASIDTDD